MTMMCRLEVPLQLSAAAVALVVHGVFFIFTRSGFLLLLDVVTSTVLVWTRVAEEVIFAPWRCMFVHRRSVDRLRAEVAAKVAVGWFSG